MKDGKPAGKDSGCWASWAASPCSATMRSCSNRKGSGRWRAIRPRARSIRSRPSSGWNGKPSRRPIPRIDAIPFESEHHFMATLHKDAAGKEMLLVKGAPEVILEHCDRQQTDERTARAARPRPFHEGVGPARGAGRARAGARLAREPGRQGGQPRPGRSAEEPGPARPDRPAWTRRARKPSRP